MTSVSVRTGSFRPAMQTYGLDLGSYITLETQRQVERVFGPDSVLTSNHYPHVLIKLHSHNAMHVLVARLPRLCEVLQMERIDVIDMSDWTVREFVLCPEEAT